MNLNISLNGSCKENQQCKWEARAAGLKYFPRTLESANNYNRYLFSILAFGYRVYVIILSYLIFKLETKTFINNYSQSLKKYEQIYSHY